MRLAVFTPLPPDRSGIAAYSAELLPALADATGALVDVFVDHAARRARPGGHPAVSVRSAFDFQRLHGGEPYDVVVYQLGNARCHDYMWSYLVRFPGLVVLHDAQLHHSRARALIASGREADYRAEFAHAHPDAPADVAEFVVNGLQGSPYYLWPLRRLPLARARTVAVHNARLADELRAETPSPTPVVTLRMGTRPHRPVRRADVEGEPCFAAVGGVTAEKRIPQVLRAFARTLDVAPAARLLLVGQIPEYYDVASDARSLGISSRVTITGYVPDEALDDWLEAADVCLCLRWPTSRETSASWLRCLAAGKATVITDLTHSVDVPSLDPRTWQLQHASITSDDVDHPPRATAAVTVAIDILDEDHSLEVAMRRLARDQPLRAALGREARRWWDTHHTLAHMVGDYREAIDVARAAPLPPPDASLPAHVLDDGSATLVTVLADFGLSRPF